MDINCLIIDDEPLAIQVIETYIKQIKGVNHIASYENPIQAFEALKALEVDLIFLDIEMPLLNGIDFLKALDNPPKVIFTTAYRNYAVESYELNIVDYLLKPISFTRFFKAINKYQSLTNLPISRIEQKEEKLINDHIYVNANKKFIKINFDQIHYIESLKDYIKIHLEEKKVVTKDSISNFEQKLPQEFLRIHRSFIVNTTKITAFTKLDVEIGDKEIPIGVSYKNRVTDFLK